MLDIPYQRQEHPTGCGAAALAMVYASLGVPATQADLWPAVSQERHGELRCFTHRLCRNALDRGLAAVILRTREAWPTLTRCLAASVHVILHHRLASNNKSGHYSVLLGLTDDSVYLHDPSLGAHRCLPRAEFLRLWSPTAGHSEVVGHVLVAVASVPGDDHCAVCQQPIPTEVSCALCKASIVLRPSAAVGCLHQACPGRLFETCYCPACDMSLWWMNPPPLLRPGVTHG
ncbi:MAG: papain-like cysteine protease family protein [Gemmataceae bacterium]